MAKKICKALLTVFMILALLFNNAAPVVFNASAATKVSTSASSSKKKLKITKQPVNVVVPKGTKAKVKVTATGTKLKYKWYYKNKNSKKYTLSKSSKKSTYSVKMSSKVNGRKVYCVIKDKYGKTVKTKKVTLKMGKTLKVTKQPVSVTVPTNHTAKVKFTASGDKMKYQWYYKDANKKKFTKAKNATKNYYSVKMSNSVKNRQVYCLIKDKHGMSTKTKTVTLKMGKTLKITSQPTSAKVLSGKTASVSVIASGDKLNYKWYIKNANAKSYSHASSFKNNYYSVKMDKNANGRMVYCIVTDAYGVSIKSRVVTLSMGKTLKITTQPASTKVQKGEIASVNVVANGDGLKYNWYVKDATSDDFTLATSFTGNSYSVQMDENANASKAYCVITDAYGVSVTTQTVDLLMATELKINQQPSDQTVDCGSKCDLTVDAQGEGLNYVWYTKNIGEAEFKASEVTGSVYSTTMSNVLDGVKVYCVVSDEYDNSLTTDVVTLSAKHIYDDGVVTVPPKCTVKGEKTFTCKYCPDNYVLPVSETGHDMGDWVVIDEPTVKKEGKERSTCKNNCGYFEENVLEVLEVIYEITVKSDTGADYTVGVGNNGKYTVSDPAKFGYVFTGWKDAEGNSFSSSGVVFKDITIYPQWEADNTDSLQKLIERTNVGIKDIKITSDITVNQPIFISYETTIYSDGDYKIKRAPDYNGDIFVVGQDKDGNSCPLLQRTAVLNLGGGKGVLTIDGNRDGVTVDVVGSAIFNADSSTVNIYDGARITNNIKVGNKRINAYTYNDEYTLKRAGGAAIIVLNATLNIYGGVIDNNIVATEYTEVETESGTSLMEYNGCGGAIYNFGNVNMYGGKISNNEALRGGGMYSGRIAYLYSGEYSDNISHSYGGAISSSSSSNADTYIGATEDGDTMLFSGNHSKSAGGAIYSNTVSPIIIYGNAKFVNNSSASSGGAIYTAGPLLIDDTIFEGNSCVYSGGAIYHHYQNPDYERRLFVANNTEFNGNTSSLGGAVTLSASSQIEDEGTVADFVNCTFINNKSIVNESNEGNGGAIYVTRNSDVTVDKCEFKFNTASSKAGAISVHSSANLTITDSNFESNSAVNGGAVYITSGASVSINNADFTANAAALTEAGDGGNGGAVHVYKGKLTLKNVSMQNNSAANNAGALYIGGNDMTIDSTCEFIGNTALNHGGAIYVTYLTLEGGVKDGTTLKLNGSLFKNNTALAGGAISARSESELIITDVQFIGNTTPNAAVNTQNGGGAIYSNNSTVNIKNTIFDGNASGYYGGAIKVEECELDISNSDIINSVGGTGAAIHANISSLTINGLDLTENTSALNGIIYSNGKTSTITNLTATDNTAVSGGVLYLSSTANVTLKDSNLTANEVTSCGGVCYAKGSSVLNLQNTVVKNNSASSGGAIFSTENSTINVTDTTFSENTANLGGAIYTDAVSATISGTTFEKNSAHLGGAIYSDYGTVNFNDNTFNQNTATKNSAEKQGNGGAICVVGGTATGTGNNVFDTNSAENHGGAVYVSYYTVEDTQEKIPGVLNVTDGTFQNNTALAGGAVSVRSYCDAKFDGTTFLNNSVSGDDGKADGNSEGGGVIYVGYGSATLNNVTAKGNTAQEFGAVASLAGADFVINGGLYENNVARTSGAIHAIENSEVTITGANFKGNESSADSSTASNSGGTMGGGVVNITGGKLTVSSTTMDGNKTGYYGGAILTNGTNVTINQNSVFTNTTGRTGAVLAFRSSSKVVMQDSSITNNTTSANGVMYMNGGTLDITNVTASGNTGYNGGVLYISGGSTKATIKDSNWSNNTATNGGAININSASVEIENSEFKENSANLGGAIYNPQGTLTIKDTTFMQNTAVKDSNSSNGNGGAICVVGGTVTGTGNNLFDANSAENHGGAVYVSYINNDDATKTGGIFTLTDGALKNNSALAGGAISSRTSCEVTLTGTELSNNEATGDASNEGGGAIFTNNNALTLSGVVLDGNKTAYYGGAVNALGANATIKDNTQIKNSIGATGAAVCMRDNAVYEFENVVLSNNIATSGSGVIYATGNATLNIKGLVASNNKNNNGGVLYTSGSAVTTISDSQFNANTAVSYGGAIDHRSSGKLTITSSTFTDNKAGISGGAINAKGTGKVEIINCDFDGNETEATKTESGNIARGGGAIFVTSVGDVSVTGGSFTNNNAAGTSDATTAGKEMTDCGGAICIDGGNLVVNNATFTGNTANNGAAIGTSRSTETAMTINGCTFSENVAEKNGGGVYIQNGVKNETDSIVLNDCVFTSNTAKTASGASVYIRTDSSATINNVTSSNGTWGYNGAVYVTSGARVTLAGTVSLNGNDDIFVTGSATSAVVNYKTEEEKSNWQSAITTASNATVTYQNVAS